MNKDDWKIAGALTLLAIFIWLRDLAWLSKAEDTLPILAALPLFMWLGMPWEWKKDSQQELPLKWIVLSTSLFLFGIVTNLTLFLALSWTTLLWAWLSLRTKASTHPRILKLLIFPLIAFPWICLDAQPLGWLFRLSGAWTVAQLYALLGFSVSQEGTNLLIHELPISIEAACAGLNTLQSMFIAGSVLAFIYLGNSNRYWWNLPLIILLAWIANTLRIVFVTAVALAVNPAFALGAFHTWGGWLVISVMFCLSWLIFSMQEIPEKKPTGSSS